MAYAELAGLSAVAGLYALLLPTVAYALLGSSRQLVVGPEGSISALVGAVGARRRRRRAATQAAELAAMLALLVAACFLVARLARLGWVADYLSRPVLIGYIHGVAVVLVIGQLPKLLGIDVDAADPLPQLVEIVRELGDVQRRDARGRRARARDPAAAALRGAARAGGAAGRGRARSSRRRWLDLAPHGVAVVGDIPSGLPGARRCRRRRWRTRSRSLPAALGIFLVCFADGDPHRALVRRQHDEHVDVDQELRRHGRRAGRRRADAGAAGRRERLADGRQRRDGRAHPGRRAARRRRRRARAALPHRPDRRPADGGARRRDRLRGDRARRAGRVAGGSRTPTTSSSRSRR